MSKPLSCSLISIYTYSSAWNLFMSKQTEKVKKLKNWVILVADIYIQCYALILQKFSEKKKYWYLNWVNCKPFIYLLWSTSIIQLHFWFKNGTFGWLTFPDSWNTKHCMIKWEKHENVWFWSIVQINSYCT